MADLIGIFIMSAIFISFFLSPIIALICGIVRASKYNDAKLQHIIKPDSYTDEDIKDLKKSVIATFITALVLAIIVVSILILFADDLVYM